MNAGEVANAYLTLERLQLSGGKLDEAQGKRLRETRDAIDSAARTRRAVSWLLNPPRAKMNRMLAAIYAVVITPAVMVGSPYFLNICSMRWVT